MSGTSSISGLSNSGTLLTLSTEEKKTESKQKSDLPKEFQPKGGGLAEKSKSINSRIAFFNGLGEGPKKVGTPKQLKTGIKPQTKTIVPQPINPPLDPKIGTGKAFLDLPIPKGQFALQGMAKQAKALAAELQTGENNHKVPLRQLSADKRKLVIQLTQRYTTCKLLAKAPTHRAVVEDTFAQVVNPKIGKNMSGTTNLSLADKNADFTKAIRGELKTFIPHDLAKRKVFKLKGERASAAKNEIIKQFQQALKNDPKLRTASGLHPDQAKAAINSFVKDLKLPSAVRGELKNSLTALVEGLPNSGNVTKGNMLGQGAMGVVYSGEYAGKNVVIKESKAEEQIDVRNTVHEVMIHESVINNPNLPKIHGLFLSDDNKFTIVMEKVPGDDCLGLFMQNSEWKGLPNIPEYKSARGPLPTTFQKAEPQDKMKASVHVLAGVVNGLAGMHASGVGHFDLKPDNVMLNSETMQGMLIDLGLSGAPGQNSKLIGDADQPGLTPNGNYPFKTDYRSEFPPLNEEVFALGKIIKERCMPNELTGPQKAVVEAATDLMQRTPGSTRPTMAQLNQVFKGEPVTLATGEQEGIRTQGEFETLRLAFGPNGNFGGGLEILSNMMNA
jgi:tRNA A-37 threonylcarbamoyl transferase component Bud32